jgi:hypothetical protein
VSRARGIKVAVAIEYLKKAIDTGGIWARTTLVLIIDKPKIPQSITLAAKLNCVLSPLLLLLWRFARADSIMLTTVEFQPCRCTPYIPFFLRQIISWTERC